ncbi:hypothetical protein [Nocardioides yefusunii]|uniref:Uncharacterized protein n=1 Tax=Nocardioides yefusunii TaxID=2500546 RepID=A0ABW1QWF1_9ACTN|nr:hypothetical protein [Nocardioides yefusunii]
MPNQDTSVQFRVSYYGTSPTAGPVLVRIAKPGTNEGTLTLGTLPTGWTEQGSTAEAFLVTSTLPMGQARHAVLSLVYRATQPNVPPLQVNASIVPSGNRDDSPGNNSAHVSLAPKDLAITISGPTITTGTAPVSTTVTITNMGQMEHDISDNTGMVQVDMPYLSGTLTAVLGTSPGDRKESFLFMPPGSSIPVMRVNAPLPPVVLAPSRSHTFTVLLTPSAWANKPTARYIDMKLLLNPTATEFTTSNNTASHLVWQNST